jgi:SAM-dependent methyltransferase
MPVSSLLKAAMRSPVVRRLLGMARHEYFVYRSRRPMVGPIPVITDDLRLPVDAINNWAEYTQWRDVNGTKEAEEDLSEEELCDDRQTPVTFEGTCALCGRDVTYHADYRYASRRPNGRLVPNFREQLSCPACGMQNRLRAIIHIFLQECAPKPGDVIYVTEQFGRFFRWLRGRFGNEVHGSEFLGPDVAPGSLHRGIRHEDLQALSFAAASFDYVMSCDVLEHIADVDKCLREVARVLKPGGSFLFTAQFQRTSEQTAIRAQVGDDGRIVHLKEPEYHGNPTGIGDGILCFRYFGIDVLDQLRAVGFETAHLLLYRSRRIGYIGGTQMVVLAKKAKQPA